jgi:hypothetical protein
LHSTKQILRPAITSLKEFYNHSDSLVRWPGQTGGAIRLSLIFLFLFLSREKERRRMPENDHFLFMFFWLEPKEPKVQAKNKCSAVFGRPTHMDSYQECKYIMTSN